MHGQIPDQNKDNYINKRAPFALPKQWIGPTEIFDHLPYRSIEPDIKDLVRVSFKGNLSSPLQVSWYWSWFQALFKPWGSNLARVSTPIPCIKLTMMVSLQIHIHSYVQVTFFHWFCRPCANISCQLQVFQIKWIRRQKNGQRQSILLRLLT